MNQPTNDQRICEGASRLPVSGMRSGVPFEVEDWVAQEVAVALEFNGISHAVMLATPLDLEDFALGFSLSEGILCNPQELFDVEETPSARGITLHLKVANAAFERLKERRRSLSGLTGCGLCGTESLLHVGRELPALAPTTPLNSRMIGRAMSQVFSLQTLQQATGAVHAAAWCSTRGEVVFLREDVGRHNALDKLVGAMVKSKVDPTTGFVAITSRASFEMVQKTALAGVPILAAVSAPTTYAITKAQEAHLTLVGFARHQDLVVYCQPERLNLDAAIETLHGH